MSDPLSEKLKQLAEDAEAESFAVTFHDCESGREFAVNGGVTFHAASTIKVAVLYALFRAVEEGRVVLEDRLHVRNRFFSIHDGSPFQLDASRDGDTEVYGRIGRTMPIAELAKWMIISSSNLATNLLLDLIGLEFARKQLEAFPGLELRRGVEDHAAYDAGINNETTSDAMAGLLLAIQRAETVTKASRAGMLDILFEQRFNDMIPKGLPDTSRVAHKTGEISSACHDVGLVFPAEAEPYVVAILTKSSASASTRRQLVASIAREIHEHYREGKNGG